TCLSAAKLKDVFNCYLCDEALHHVHAENVDVFDFNTFFSSQSGEKKAISLRNVHERLTGKRSLVFLISDYHIKYELLIEIFHSLKRHWLVPVVIWTSKEKNYPNWGFAKLKDAEGGKTRTILLTPRYRRIYELAWVKRRKKLDHLFSEFGLSPFFIEDRFYPQKMTEYFCSR
ncbi:MAG: hypothetical protein MI865_09765, partial [Proteobacteria bacterium]|nr:hypothetical protein [Pseudomonadota bacterium]